jgi:hypothetical protein
MLAGSLLASWPLLGMNSNNLWFSAGWKLKFLKLNPFLNRGEPNPTLVLHYVCIFLKVSSNLVELGCLKLAQHTVGLH